MFMGSGSTRASSIIYNTFIHLTFLFPFDTFTMITGLPLSHVELLLAELTGVCKFSCGACTQFGCNIC